MREGDRLHSAVNLGDSLSFVVGREETNGHTYSSCYSQVPSLEN